MNQQPQLADRKVNRPVCKSSVLDPTLCCMIFICCGNKHAVRIQEQGIQLGRQILRQLSSAWWSCVIVESWTNNLHPQPPLQHDESEQKIKHPSEHRIRTSTKVQISIICMPTSRLYAIENVPFNNFNIFILKLCSLLNRFCIEWHVPEKGT